MRAFYPSAPKDFATWLRPGPILKGDEEELLRRPPTPTITRPVEVATIAAPLMRSSPSAPLLLSAASPSVPGPGFHFAQVPREVNPSPQVFGFETPIFRGAPPAVSYAAPQQTMIAQMPGPCRQRSAPVLLGAQQAQLQSPASPGTLVQSKELPMRQAGAHGAQPTIHSPTPRLQQATNLRPDVEGAKLRPQGVMMPFPMSPDGTPAVQIPCRQQSAPVIAHQVTVVTTTRCPEGPWMTENKETKEAKEVQEQAARELPGSKQKAPAKVAQRLHSPPATSSRRREAAIKSEAAVMDAFVRRHRRRSLMGSCMATWAVQWRASTRAKMRESLENCRKLQDEVTLKTAVAKQAEVELMRRTEDEFKRLREVQTELLQLQQEAPALQAVKVSSAPFRAPRVAKLCFFAWLREARSRQQIFKLLRPSRVAEERTLLRRCWAVWQPQRLRRRFQAAVSKLAAATLDKEATAFLRQILLAWYGQKVSRKPATKGGDICTMNTAPLSAALTYQSAVIRDRPEQIPSPASTRPLNMLPKEANGMREGDATPPPPPPPARRNSVGGGASQKKSDFVPITAAERLQEAAKMVEIPSPVLPAARPGGVQWRAAVWPMPGDSQTPFVAQRPGGEKMMLRLGQAKYCGAN